MPLADFVRYLNAQLPISSFGSRSTSPFVSESGRVFVYFGDLRLDSDFSPIVDTASGTICGHAARLSVTRKGTHQPIEPADVFKRPNDSTELIVLDRLVRTLHALNYLITPGRREGGLLLLKVHPRHVASVAADHGVAFEEILRACGLLPKQITLELEIDGVDYTVHLVRAIANYKLRGYGIGLGRLGSRASDLPLLRKIRPTHVKFDRRLLVSDQPIRPVIEQLHHLGAQVILESFNTATVRDDARENGFDLLQVRMPECRLLNAPEKSSATPDGAPDFGRAAA